MSNKSMIEQGESHLESARLSADKLEAIVQTVRDAVQSPETKRAYERALRDFMAWYIEQGEPVLNKATIRRYLASLRESGMSAASINQRRAAINKLVREAADNSAIPEQDANGILRIEGESQPSSSAGNWLTKEQAQALLNAPDKNTLRGKRDRALLFVALNTGLRRSEIARLTFAQIQMREERWLLAGIVGKGNKKRDVPIAAEAKQAISTYAEAAGISEGRVFRRIRRGDHLAGQSLTSQAIYDLGIEYFGIARERDPALFDGVESLAAHDLRRTFAQLARKAGSPIEQISLNLGHSSIAITQRYLGVELDLHDAPADRIGLRLE